MSTSSQTPCPASASALLRHFADLRDGTHGDAGSRRDKERLFAAAVPLLDPHARQALAEINTYLLLGPGGGTRPGVPGPAGGGPGGVWGFVMPREPARGYQPGDISRLLGSGFAHPHLQSGTVGDWPLN